ncbi:RabGAP/TBC [Jaminaea rosea]|uniref:RabGAP/TBC n=1 Tax=Jaminaea rosea TaxID=1569628 RepID=A0A316USK9_9BASI|nr:RabGAP/TBC [Jaminaea rosea]PWN28277.1 RabGAP/TBC [Jaminaea rosea]
MPAFAGLGPSHSRRRLDHDEAASPPEQAQPVQQVSNDDSFKTAAISVDAPHLSVASSLPQRPRTADPIPVQPPHPPAITSSGESIASTESWTRPEDGEGDFVRRTYLHFDRTGIEGDGTVQGEEWTRNRSVGAASGSSLAPWQAANGKRHRPRQRRTNSAPDRRHLHPGDEPLRPLAGRKTDEPAVKSSPLASSEPITAATTAAESAVFEDQEMGDAGGEGASSIASETAWPDLDRYGFFGGRDWDSHSATGRIVVLPAACYAFVPSPSTSASSSKGKVKVRSAAKKAKKSLKRTGVSEQNWTGLPASASDEGWGSSMAGASTASGPSDQASPQPNGDAKHATKAEEPPEDVITSLRLPSESLGRSKEQARIDKWAAMLAPVAKEGGNTTSYRLTVEGLRDRDRLERRIYKGIPDRWRAAAWWALLQRESGSAGESSSASFAPSHSTSQQPVDASNGAGAASSSAQSFPSHGHVNPSPTPSINGAAMSQYSRLLTLPSPYTVQIDLDVPRTISNHVLFRTRYGWGQVRLFKLLHAYSLGCSECGYCQGMGGIAVVMVSLFPEEEKSWAVLRRLHDGPTPDASLAPSSALHRLFSPGFPLLLELFHVQSALLRTLFPSFARILEDAGVEASSYATRWYMTCFYGVLPWETCLRVWDVLMWEEGGHGGAKEERGLEWVLPLVGLSILWAVGHRVVTSGPSAAAWDFESLLSLLSSSNLFVPQDDDALLLWVRGLRNDARVRRVMAQAVEEWRAMQS